jgi:integrase
MGKTKRLKRKDGSKYVGLPEGTPCTVEPIRDPAKVKAISRMLKDNPRDHLFFTIGINAGLRGIDLLRLKVGQFQNVKPGDVVKVLEPKTKRSGKPKDEPANNGPSPELGDIIADERVLEALKKHFNLKPKKKKPIKRRAKLNEVVINKSIMAALKAYFKAYPDAKPDEPLFKSTRGGKALTSRAMGMKVKAWCEAVGVKGCGINSLRKTFAYQHIVTNGQPINRITAALNHSDGVTTMRYCGASRDETRKMRMMVV